MKSQVSFVTVADGFAYVDDKVLIQTPKHGVLAGQVFEPVRKGPTELCHRIQEYSYIFGL